MVKTRVNGECTFDENGYKRRAACVVFRDDSEQEVFIYLFSIQNQFLEVTLIHIV